MNNIDNAVKNGWIVLFYQPVFWADSGELCGCEAQARFLKGTGCSRLQCYLFGRPVPRDALYDRIAKGELTVSPKLS